MKKIAQRSCLIVGTAIVTAMATGCGPAGLSSAVAQSATGPSARLTEHVASSAFMIVADGTVTGATVLRSVIATAQPDETLEILQTGVLPRIVVASVSPAPATAVVPGKPASPGQGASSYQLALYTKRFHAWQGMVVAGMRNVAIRTRASVARWTRGLRIRGRAIGRPGSLAVECSAAASAEAGLGQAGDRFGAGRVILVYAATLSGTLTTDELTGADVIVITSFLPSTAAASATQADLLRAGAVRAAVLGPEETASQLDKLIIDGLSHRQSNDSTRIHPSLYDSIRIK
jgi:hypothetical protein